MPEILVCVNYAAIKGASLFSFFPPFTLPFPFQLLIKVFQYRLHAAQVKGKVVPVLN
jgi:hypothetical protein